jgi:hypothetical protein
MAAPDVCLTPTSTLPYLCFIISALANSVLLPMTIATAFNLRLCGADLFLCVPVDNLLIQLRCFFRTVALL